MNRHEEEDQRGALMDKKRGERREYQYHREKQRMEERGQLKSRRDYCRSAKSTISISRGPSRLGDRSEGNNNGTRSSGTSSSSKGYDEGSTKDIKSDNETTEELKQVLKKLEDIAVAHINKEGRIED